MFGLKLNIFGNFHQLEVVGRGSETQLQVGENLNTIPWRTEGYQDQLNHQSSPEPVYKY